MIQITCDHEQPSLISNHYLIIMFISIYLFTLVITDINGDVELFYCDKIIFSLEQEKNIVNSLPPLHSSYIILA